MDEIVDLYYLQENVSDEEVDGRMRAWDEERRSVHCDKVEGRDREMARLLCAMGCEGWRVC